MWQTILPLLIFSLAITPTTSNAQFIRKSCNTTSYPEVCNSYLSRFSTRIGTSPRLLAQTAIAATLTNTRTTSTNLRAYSKTRNLTKRETGAIEDCLVQIDDSAYQLRKSMVQMGKIRAGSEFLFNINSIQTWVSAVLTDDDTCTNGISNNNINTEVKTTVREYVIKIAHLASIALAFVNKYAANG